MKAVKQLLRLTYINWVLMRHGLDEVVLATHLFRPVGFLAYLSPWRWFREKDVPRAVRIRRVLEDLGPIFIKFGQLLSTRRDLLPDDIALELARLQDNVPSFPSEQARQIVEKAYKKPLNELFAAFDAEPLASASIAQVHAAQLLSGEKVVVKIVRPGIESTIRSDLELLYTIAELAERYWQEAKRLRPLEVVAEYEKTIIDELDLMREAASASQLRRNFEDSALLYVPEVHWPLTRPNVMVMERISGTPVSDIKRLNKMGVDLKQLAENGVEIFFTQVFGHNFFHADMHPGNIFVSPEGQYIAVDFGIMGTLSPEDQRYLAGNFLAFFHRDYRKVAELHVESGWVPAGTRIDEFESAIRTVCEPIFDRPLQDISFGHLLLRLFQTARRFNMQVQPQLVLLQKTLLNIEGLGRQLYPELDLWQTAKPFLERWMSEQLGVRSLVKSLKDNSTFWTEKFPEMPQMLYDALKRHQPGQPVAQSAESFEQIRREIRRANQRTVKVVIGSVMIICAVLLLQGLADYAPVKWANAPVLTWMLGGLGALILVFAWPSHKD
ncbi:MAG: ubiquinone biosynthesis regulatory protein kinase UbiB [Gammaproteobacteria bacterium]|nr:ubiquinone biosynthesis regulatory protein kinase UbiB [Gammaproteobacteria bacterium]